MDNDMYFNVNEVSLSNLKDLLFKRISLEESSICEISFIVDSLLRESREIFGDDIDINDIISLIDVVNEENNYAESISESVAPNLLLGYLSNVGIMEKSAFASLLAEKLSQSGLTVLESDFLDSSPCDESFAYVKNGLSDEAFDVFSQEFSAPRIKYCQTIKEACVAVRDGEAGYCIVPFEEKGVRIPTIAELVRSLDLKIVAITPVFGFEGTADTKYALISGGFKIPDHAESTDRYLEIDFDSPVASVVVASEYLGYKVYRISSSVIRDDGERVTHSAIIKDGGRGFTELLIYLSVSGVDFSPAGIYKNIE